MFFNIFVIFFKNMKNLIIATLFVAFGVVLFWNSFPAFLDATMLLLQLCFTITTILLPLLLVVGAVFGVAKLTKRI